MLFGQVTYERPMADIIQAIMVATWLPPGVSSWCGQQICSALAQPVFCNSLVFWCYLKQPLADGDHIGRECSLTEKHLEILSKEERRTNSNYDGET